MPRPLDTPARAAKARRPQTREWRRLLSEAEAQDESAIVIRQKLRMHLDAADRLASKLQVPPQPPQVITHAHPLQTLDSLENDWNERVQALQSLCENPNTFNIEPLATWLSKQLGDLRSKVVVCASEAIACVASRRLFSAEQAAEVFCSAAAGVSVAKKVMADARRTAAEAVIEGHSEGLLFDAIAGVAKDSRHPAARRLALDALATATEKIVACTSISDQVASALTVGAVDRAPDVREGALELANTFRKKFGGKGWDKVKSSLPKEVVTRLEAKRSSGKKGTGIKTGSVMKPKGLAARNGKSMRELIRQRREAMKKEVLQNACSGQDVKRTSEDSKVESQVEPPKKDASVKPGKENVPGEV